MSLVRAQEGAGRSLTVSSDMAVPGLEGLESKSDVEASQATAQASRSDGGNSRWKHKLARTLRSLQEEMERARPREGKTQSRLSLNAMYSAIQEWSGSFSNDSDKHQELLEKIEQVEEQIASLSSSLMRVKHAGAWEQLQEAMLSETIRALTAQRIVPNPQATSKQRMLWTFAIHSMGYKLSVGLVSADCRPSGDWFSSYHHNKVWFWQSCASSVSFLANGNHITSTSSRSFKVTRESRRVGPDERSRRAVE